MQKMPSMQPGTKVGRLLVQYVRHKRSATTGKMEYIALTVCDCGNKKQTRVGNLGRTVFSCGCLRRESVASRSKTHGQSGGGKHAGRSPLYKMWSTMCDRCANGEVYLRRKIRVCDEWLDFSAFAAYMNEHLGKCPPRHSLDRIDNQRGYEPGNVRYGSPKTQARNRSNNTLMTLRGETKCLAEWSEVSGVQRATIHQRLKLGWPAEDAVFVPVGARGRWSKK